MTRIEPELTLIELRVPSPQPAADNNTTLIKLIHTKMEYEADG